MKHLDWATSARHRIGQELNGTLRPRPMDKAIYAPTQASNSLAQSPWEKDFRQPDPWTEQSKDEIAVLENCAGAFSMPLPGRKNLQTTRA